MSDRMSLEQSLSLLASLRLDLVRLSLRGQPTSRLDIPCARREEYAAALDVLESEARESRVLLAGVRRKIHELEMGLAGVGPEAMDLRRVGAEA